MRRDEGALCTDDDMEHNFDLFIGYEVDAGLIVERRAWYAIGWDEAQFYYVVDLDDEDR